MTQSRSEIRNSYDRSAQAYAKIFLDELKHKPRDVELLQQFASSIGTGKRVLDIGCGPGHTTAHLASLGLKPTGVDLSCEMIAKAKALFPDVAFVVGDLFQLPEKDNSVDGLLAFYCIVHLQSEELLPAFNEMFRVLEQDGILLLSFHVGSDPVVQEDFLESGVRLEFFPFLVADVESALLAAGFSNVEIHERPPYDTEYPSDRCYILATKQKAG